MHFKQDVGDKRNSVRVDFNLPVELYSKESDNRLRGQLVNISAHGMLVQFQDDIASVVEEEDVHFMVRIIFPGRGSNLIINDLQTTVVHINDNKISLEFSEPLEWFLLFYVYKGKQASRWR